MASKPRGRPRGRSSIHGSSAERTPSDSLKQYLLHHGYAGRLSTAGNLAFPFTPPEVSLGPAYRFNVYHLLRTPDSDALFPLEVEAL